MTLAAAAALATAAGARRAAAQTVWNGGTGNWNTAGNWTPGTVPNSGTINVSIDGGKGTVASVVNLDLIATIGSLTIDAGDTLSFNAGAGLTFNGNTTVNGLMSIGTNGGSAFTVTFAGTNALTLGGTGQVVFGTPSYQLNNTTGTNALTLGAGLMIHGRNVAFVGNVQGGYLNLATVSADVAGGTFELNCPFTNGAGGVLSALNGGKIQFDTQAGSSGAGATMLAGAGSLLLFNTGNFTIADGGAIIGAGTASVTSANLIIAGAATISSALSFSGGFISGSGPLSINGPLLWTGGQFGLTAGTATANNGITISGIGSKVMSAYHLINAATSTANWGGAGGMFLGGGSFFENKGTFNATNDATIQTNGGAPSSFLNTGTFNKSSTANAATSINIGFTNSGTVNVTSGTLALGGGGSAPNGSFVIAPGATLAFTGGGYNVDPSGTISGAGTVSISIVQLSVTGNYTISSPLSLISGLISGTGALSLTAPLTWTGGQFGAGGGTATASNGITITGPQSKGLSAYHLVNAATSTATWGGASIFLSSGAVLENRGTFNATNDASIANNGGAASGFLNTGTFTKSSTANASTIIGIPFTNSGTVNINSGTLEVSAGGSAPGGTFAIAAGGTLLLNGGTTFNIDPTTTITGSGTAAVAGANLSLSGANVAINSPLTLSSGNISGSSALAINGPFTWTGGQLGAGNGIATVNSGMTLSGGASKALSTYHLVIAPGATANWGGAGGIFLGAGSILENKGTFNATNDASIANNGGAPNAFVNSGIFNKSSTANASTIIGIAFTNSGIVNINSGTLEITAGGSAPAGKFNIASGATAFFNGGTFNIDPTTMILGSGTMAVAGATVNHGSGAAGVTIAAPLTFSSGFITGSNALALNTPFSWTGGTFGPGNGTATVNADMTLSGTQNKVLSAYRLVIAPTATANWGGGFIFLGSGSVLENRGAFNATNDSSVLNNGGALSALVNSGTLTKSSTANASTVIGIPFTNSGTVNITSGILDINAGGSAPGGKFILAPAGTLLFDNGTFNVDSTTTITGNGTVSLAGATLSLTGASVSIPSPLSFSSGFISGSSALSINGPFSWTGGTFGGGNGTATINTSGATISGPGNKVLSLYHVVIAPTATVNWTGPGNIFLGNASILENAGTCNMLTDNSILFNGGAISSLVNSGVINKSSTGGISTVIGVPFTNSGAVNINSGIFDVNLGGSAPTGTFAIAGGAGLLFDNGTFTLGSGAISGAGTAIVNLGTLAVPGSSVISAPLSFIAGVISGSGSLAINGPLAWSGGAFGGGSGTATANAGIAISGAASKTLVAYRLVNGPTSTVTWSGVGGIFIGAAGVFENRGTFNATNDASVVYNGGGLPFFLNSGTFNKSSTANASTVIGIAFTNSGTVNITSGILNLNAGGSDTGGVYNTSVGGNLLFTSNHSLDGASSIAGPGLTTVGTTNGAIANISGGLKNFNQGTLIVNTNGSLALASNGARVTSHVDSLTINGNGTFDLGMNELLTLSSPALIKTYLANAYDAANFQDWSKPGLTSRLAKVNPTTFSVGYANGNDQSAQDAGVTLHSGAPLGPTQTVVRAVLTGDANMDGSVDFFDITQILGYKYNTGQSASYTDGDLDYSGKVDFFDIVLLLSANYNSGQVFGPAAAVAAAHDGSLTGAGHVASSTGAIASATTIGGTGDGKPDFEYDPATGHLRFRTDGGAFTTTGGSASFVSSLTISSASGILLPGGASSPFATGTGATLTSMLLSSALTNTPGFSDGFDIGIVLAPGLDAATLAADLTVKYQSLNGGQLKAADITFIPEPAGLGLLGLAAAGMMGRRRRYRNRIRRPL